MPKPTIRLIGRPAGFIVYVPPSAQEGDHERAIAVMAKIERDFKDVCVIAEKTDKPHLGWWVKLAQESAEIQSALDKVIRCMRSQCKPAFYIGTKKVRYRKWAQVLRSRPVTE